MRRLVLSFVFLAYGCGVEPAPSIAPTLHMDGLMAEDTLQLSLFVFSDKRSDGVFLTCSNLLKCVVLPDSNLLDTLGSLVVPFSTSTSRNATLDNIKAGPRRIVYVEARGAANALVGSGCQDGVNVSEETTASVDLTIFPADQACQ